ncbi:MAG: dTMP kinase [Bacillota bacterium]
MSGFFISLEGIDGVGKTTQAQRLAERLRELRFEVVTVREPGGTATGEAIRDVLKDPARTIDARAEACLYAAARAELVTQVIQPALEAGKIVLADRYADSTIAYQGAGRGLPEELLRALSSLVTGGLYPDLTIIIDLPAGEALARLSRTKTADRMERLELSFFERVRERYLRLAAESRDRFAVVDGTGTVEQVENEIYHVVREALAKCTTLSGGKTRR